MYNKTMKEGFIKDYMRARVVAQTSLYSLFRKTEEYEIKLKKDCGAFSEEEILRMYEGFQARSKFTVFNYNVILKAYCAWMQYYHGAPAHNAYDNITTTMIAPLVPKSTKTLLTRQDILDIEDQLYNYSDKAIVELLFLGVAGKNMEDIYAVDKRCVRGDKLIVNGKEFPITERLCELLPKAFAETEIMSYGETMRIVQVVGAGRIYKERSNARGVSTADSVFRFFYRKIQLYRNYLDMPGLTMKNISASGLYYFLQDGMQRTNLDMRSFLRTDAGKQIAKRYGFSEDYYIDNICAKYDK